MLLGHTKVRLPRELRHDACSTFDHLQWLYPSFEVYRINLKGRRATAVSNVYVRPFGRPCMLRVLARNQAIPLLFDLAISVRVVVARAGFAARCVCRDRP